MRKRLFTNAIIQHWKLKISKLGLEMHRIFSNKELINHWDNSLVDLLTFPQEQLCFHLANVFVLV